MADGPCAGRSVARFIDLYGFASSLNMSSQFLESGEALAPTKCHGRKSLQCAMQVLLSFVLNALLSGLISWPSIFGWEEIFNTCLLDPSCVICGFIDLSYFMVSIASFPVGLHLSSFCIYQLPLSWL